MLIAAGVQRSGIPAESKHPYPKTTAASRFGAATNAADCWLMRTGGLDPLRRLTEVANASGKKPHSIEEMSLLDLFPPRSHLCCNSGLLGRGQHFPRNWKNEFILDADVLLIN